MDDLSTEQIALWKAEYGSVYQTTYKNQTYVFRAITLREYEEVFSDISSSVDSEDNILATALLHPQDANFDRLPAGIVSTIASGVLEAAGFQNPKRAKQKLDTQRETSADVFVLMKALILTTMPTYKEEELDSLTFDQLLKKVVLAEKIIEVQQAIMGGGDVKLVLVDPEEEAAEEEQAKAKHTVQKKPGTASYDDPIAQKLHNALG